MFSSVLNELLKDYNPVLELQLIEQVQNLKASSLTSDLSDLLSFSIMYNYNQLAKEILEKDYQGKKIDLVRINAIIIMQSSDASSLLHFAAKFSNKEMIIYFIDHNIPISYDNNSMTLLHLVALSSKFSKEDIFTIVDKVKKIAAEVINSQDNDKHTALYYAARENNRAAFEALIKNGALKDL
jgi:ankyrin repeat protein